MKVIGEDEFLELKNKPKREVFIKDPFFIKETVSVTQ